MTRSPWDRLPHAAWRDDDPEGSARAADLGWELERVPVFAEHAGRTISVPGREALVRRDTGSVVSMMSRSATVDSNLDVLRRMAETARRAGARLEIVGTMRGGRVVWGVAGGVDGFAVPRHDHVDAKVLMSVFRAYGHTNDARLLALRNRMRSSYVSRPIPLAASPSDIAAFMRARGVELEDRARSLSAARVDRHELRDYLRRVIGIRPAERALARLAEERGRAETWWDALGIAWGAIDYQLGHSDETRVQSAWYGANRIRRERAIEEAVAAVNKKLRRGQPVQHKTNQTK